MKTEPLLGAAAFGAVAAVLYNLINTLIAVQSPALEGLGMGLNCFVGLLIALVTGFLYATLHRREAPLTAGVGAKGGLAAGALAFAINGVVSVVIVMLLGPEMMEATLASDAFSQPVDGQALGYALIIGTVLLTCAGVVVGALASAAGGAVGAALLGSQEAKPGASGVWRGSRRKLRNLRILPSSLSRLLRNTAGKSVRCRSTRLRNGRPLGSFLRSG